VALVGASKAQAVAVELEKSDVKGRWRRVLHCGCLLTACNPASRNRSEFLASPACRRRASRSSLPSDRCASSRCRS